MNAQYPYSGFQPPASGPSQPHPAESGQPPQISPPFVAGGAGAPPPRVPPTPPSPTPDAPMPSRAQYNAERSVRAPKTGPGWGALIGAMAATALVSVGLSAGLSLGPAADDDATLTAAQSEDYVPIVGGDQVDWEVVAAAVRPATVSISAVSQDSAGTGSGVIIDPAGTIVTNNHVVANVTNGGELTVTLSDGRVYPAELVGTDPTTDVAVIRITGEADGLVAANLASSDTLKPGQPVMAIGSPLGLSDTVTTGVISAVDRPVVVSADSQESDPVITNAIQVDAAINQGNSGGPLFDQTGSVIGINSSIASLGTSAETAGSIGLGFAIPIDLVKSVTDQILEDGTVKHALLGVQIGSGSVTVDGVGRVGAIVQEVTVGGAADQAGLRQGDVIVAVDGNSVVSGPSLTGFIRRYVAGQEVTLDVVRDGVKQQVTVTLQEK